MFVIAAALSDRNRSPLVILFSNTRLIIRITIIRIEFIPLRVDTNGECYQVLYTFWIRLKIQLVSNVTALWRVKRPLIYYSIYLVNCYTGGRGKPIHRDLVGFPRICCRKIQTLPNGGVRNLVSELERLPVNKFIPSSFVWDDYLYFKFQLLCALPNYIPAFVVGPYFK